MNPHAYDDSMNVAAIQTNPRYLDYEWNLRDIERHVANARDADIIVLPELCTTGYNFCERCDVERYAEDAVSGPTSQMLQDLAQAHDVYIAAGYPERAGGKIYNSQLLVGPAGVEHSYRKVHLFADEKRFFAPGESFYVSQPIMGARLGLMVCFDWFFPESMRTLMLKGADIVLHSANLVLPYCPDAMVTRCIENRVFAVTANRVGTERGLTFIGSSQITACNGEILVRLPKEGVATAMAPILPHEARNKDVTPQNNILKDLALDAYRIS